MKKMKEKNTLKLRIAIFMTSVVTVIIVAIMIFALTIDIDKSTKKVVNSIDSLATIENNLYDALQSAELVNNSTTTNVIYDGINVSKLPDCVLIGMTDDKGVLVPYDRDGWCNNNMGQGSDGENVVNIAKIRYWQKINNGWYNN